MKALKKTAAAASPQTESGAYPAFEQLNGEHPWRRVVPTGFVDYPARVLPGGRVAYFNFDLAKEMGLISPDHAHVMNPALERSILDTFALQIINEYDQINGKRAGGLKEGVYMATRYLQFQHPSRTGRTSGDGRSIWIGSIKGPRKVFDVMARGTGVTCLAPGAVEAGKPLRTGCQHFGYASGLADLDEIIEGTLLSEVFYARGVPTERTLAAIDFGKGRSIGVRAVPNLLRPAHLFALLKQNDTENLRRGMEYLIARQSRNREWDVSPDSPRRFDMALREISRSFARLAAIMEEEYIFHWIDWDGDNMLATGSILDYGCVRQFGLLHDAYRYEDVDRYSSSMAEQRFKARQNVQVFCQIIEMLKSDGRVALSDVSRHAALKQFDEDFLRFKALHFLRKVGFSEFHAAWLMKKCPDQVSALYDEAAYFARAKSSRGRRKTPDGINTPALYDVRSLWRVLPARYGNLPLELSACVVPPRELMPLLASEYASRKESALTPERKRRLLRLQECYRSLLLSLPAAQKDSKPLLRELSENASRENPETPLTSDGLAVALEDILKRHKKGELNNAALQWLSDSIICIYSGRLPPARPPTARGRQLDELLARFMDRCAEYKHGL